MISIFILIFISLFTLLQKRLDLFLYLFLFSLIYFPLLLYWQGYYQYRDFVPLALLFLLITTNLTNVIKYAFFRKTIIKLVVIVIALILVISIASFTNDYNTFKGLLFFRNEFWGVLLFSFIACTKIPQININRILLFIITTQFVLVILQLFGGSAISKLFLLIEFENNKGIMIEGTTASVVEMTVESGGYLLTGSFCKITKLANFMALFITFWTGYRMSKNKKFYLLDFIVIISSFIVIILSGVRAPLVSGLIGFVMSFTFVVPNKVRNFRFLLICIGIILVTLPTLMVLGKSSIISGANYGDGANRILSIFGVLSNWDNLNTSNSYTLGRSIYMLQFVSWQTVLFGTGIYNINPMGYGVGLASISDCMLVFVIAEYGIIVLALCLMIYQQAIVEIKRVCDIRDYRTILVLFIVIIIQTIVDPGIFDTLTKYMFYILCALVLQESKMKNMNIIKYRQYAKRKERINYRRNRILR